MTAEAPRINLFVREGPSLKMAVRLGPRKSPTDTHHRAAEHRYLDSIATRQRKLWPVQSLRGKPTNCAESWKIRMRRSESGPRAQWASVSQKMAVNFWYGNGRAFANRLPLTCPRLISSDYTPRLPGSRAKRHRWPRTFRASLLPRPGFPRRPRVPACSRRHGRAPRCHPPW
jgi:hypothetical protein